MTAGVTGVSIIAADGLVFVAAWRLIPIGDTTWLRLTHFSYFGVHSASISAGVACASAG